MAAVLGLAACNEEINDYTTQTAPNPAEQVFIADSIIPIRLSWNADTVDAGVDTVWVKFPVQVTKPAASDIKVTLMIDNDLMTLYNAEHGTNYSSLAAADLTTDLDVTIPAGQTESTDSVSIAYNKSIKNLLDTNGYMIPVRIRYYSGVDIAPDYQGRHSYIFLNVARENAVRFSRQETSIANFTVAPTGYADGFVDVNTLSFQLSAYYPAKSAATVTVAVNNSLIDAYNTTNGTEFLPVPAGALTQSYPIDFAVGEVTKTVSLAYTGDKTSLNDLKGYLIPLEITSVTGEGMNKVTARSVYYVKILVSTLKLDAVAAIADMTGSRVTAGRTGYKVLRAVDMSGANLTGTVSNIFTDADGTNWSQGSFNGNLANFTIDLGTEQEITGVELQGYSATAAQWITSLEVRYSTEETYAKNQDAAVGKVLIASPARYTYLRFSEPVTARYIHLNDIAHGNNATFGLQQFYIYVKGVEVVGQVINGVTWAECNVAEPGKFSAKPSDAGLLYQWGRATGWSVFDPMKNSDNGTSWNAAKPKGDVWGTDTTPTPAPAGWRVPTVEELDKLLDNTKVTRTWTKQDGVEGYSFTDITTGDAIFLPAAGYRADNNGTLKAFLEDQRGGYYWTASPNLSNLAWFLNFSSTGLDKDDEDRAMAFSIRCVKE